MADIFLSYGGARQLVRDFETVLTRQGHKVYSASDFDFRRETILARLREFDAIIVIWSELSADDGLSAAVATEARRLGRLIPTLAPRFPNERIPPAFRALLTLAVSDTPGIASAIAALGVAPGPKDPQLRRRPEREGVGAATASPYRVTPIEKDSAADAPSAAKGTEALAVEAGRLVHKIPEKMWVGVEETVEIRLGRRDAQDLATGLAGRGALISEEIPVVETMSISVYSSPGAFTIERQSETTQLVIGDAVKGTAFENGDFGRWTWSVTPKKTGGHQLFVKVSAGLKDSRGLPTTCRLPDRVFKVSVSVDTGKATLAIVRRTVPALLLAAAGGLVAAFTRDVWWPKLYGLLRSMGWLG